MSVPWLCPSILIGGAMQAVGNPMNGQIDTAMSNPCPAAATSLAIIMFLFAVLLAIIPRPLPSASNLTWAAVRAGRRADGRRHDPDRAVLSRPPRAAA